MSYGDNNGALRSWAALERIDESCEEPGKMRYLHVISSLDPAGGGPADGVLRLCSASSKSGHQVEIATLDAPGMQWQEPADCPVHNLGPSRLGRYCYAPRLPQWLRDNAGRFEAVIVDGLWQYQGLATRAALHGTSVPYFVFTHGMLDPWFRRKYPLKHAKKLLYWPWGEYRVLRDARAVLFTCEEERRQARLSFPLYRANETVVGYGTPGVEGDAAAQRDAFLDTFPALRGKRLLLFLGRIHPKKGVDLLLEAFADVARLHPDLHLVIAGPDPGGEQAELMRRVGAAIAGRVSWPGMLRGDLKWGAFHCAEAFILPSHQENFGVAVAEALSCGLPVLISNKVNIWREIHGDGAGLVADDSVVGTGDLLTRWLAMDSAARIYMSARARSCFVQRFHINAAAVSLIGAMQQHLDDSRQAVA
jgi:glycosyltransferase involved in cell wall biosynthesis